MAEKKIQENPLPEAELSPESDKPKDMPKLDKTPALPPPVTAPVRPSLPSFTKTPPNDLYRRLLPAVLFLLTFVTVMTMLLIYMDTVALGAQQFRLNMSRDYELARIGARSAALVQFVRQIHLAPRPPAPAPEDPQPTDRIKFLDEKLGVVYNGTFIEFLPRGPRDPTTRYLEAARGWAGVVARAAPRDYLALRGAARALHACLSPTDHPREVTYPSMEGGSGGSGVFRSRVLCLPLVTVALAAAEVTSAPARAQLVQLGGEAALPALQCLPYDHVSLQVLEVFSTDLAYRNATTSFLATKNYTVMATFPDSVMYGLN